MNPDTDNTDYSRYDSRPGIPSVWKAWGYMALVGAVAIALFILCW